ncbi:MAG: phosphoglycolate phosphatase [Gammaproteobacteria bacterium]
MADSRNSVRAVLFDLDGTLADTAPDMAGALAALCEERQLEPLPYAQVRPVVSHGSRGLVRLSFGDSLTDDEMTVLCERFLVHYQHRLAEQTSLFEGMHTVLEALEVRSMPWGIVTNKPGWLTEPLIRTLGLESLSGCVISGDTVSQRKPDPLPLTHAAEALRIEPKDCLYVGDAERDIVAGNAAGMKTLVALYGYIDGHEQPEHWGADGTVKTPEEILEWLN